MRRNPRHAKAAATGLLLLTLVLMGPGSQAATHGSGSAVGCSGTWEVVFSPSLSNEDFLFGVSGVSATDVWAVGDYVPTGGVVDTLIQHWDGTSWSVVPSPNPTPITNTLEDVWASSSTDAWAVGRAFPDVLVVHWDGTAWAVTPTPPQSGDNFLQAVWGISPTDVWAVGDGNSHLETLAEHWDGSSWTIVPSPHRSLTYLQDVWGASSTDVWAVGSTLRG